MERKSIAVIFGIIVTGCCPAISPTSLEASKQAVADTKQVAADYNTVWKQVLKQAIAEKQVDDVLIGDVNNDGKITVADSSEIQKYTVGALLMPTVGTDDFKRADVDGSSDINEADALVILQLINEQIDVFPASKLATIIKFVDSHGNWLNSNHTTVENIDRVFQALIK